MLKWTIGSCLTTYKLWTQNVFLSWLLCEQILTIRLYIRENVLFENYTVLWCTKCKLAPVMRPLPRSIPIMTRVQNVKVKVQPISTKRQGGNRKRFFVTLGFEETWVKFILQCYVCSGCQIHGYKDHLGNHNLALRYLFEKYLRFIWLALK